MNVRQGKVTAVFALALVLSAISSFSTNQAQAENQPRMERAIALLIEARVHLEKASRDKGGHRVKAINKAIAEVRKGIRFDNRN